MSLTDRDRKLLLFILPAVVIAAYWFLLLSPVRKEGSKLEGDLARQEQKRDELQSKVSQLGQARNDFATDYAAVVELGKAVPTSVDMPSLIVQLDKASRGTGIAFERIHAGDRLPAASASTGTTPGGPGAAPVAAGGQQAQSGPGSAAEKANDTKAQQDSQANAQSSGSAPGAAPAGGTDQTSGVPGLDAVPLEFTFRGSFFDLADFFHRMKRFVHVVNDRIDVRGRLMTIEGLDFKTTAFPRLEAQVTAKVYLTPKKEGATAGADPSGPAPTPSGGSTEASSPSPSPSSGPPSAVISR